jgi:hypothetical protein
MTKILFFIEIPYFLLDEVVCRRKTPDQKLLRLFNDLAASNIRYRSNAIHYAKTLKYQGRM